MMLTIVISVGSFSASAEEVTITPDTSWYSDGNSNFNIVDAADLLGLSSLIAEGKTFAGKTINILNDINLNPNFDANAEVVTAPKNTWHAEGATKEFNGTVNGNGHTISGMYAKANSHNYGFFASVREAGASATIKNLCIVNSYIEIEQKTDTAGTRCYIGGLFGNVKGTATIENVYSEINIVRTATSGGERYGGFCGFLDGGTITIKSSVYNGKIKNCAVSYVGGMVGCMTNSSTLSIIDSAFYGSVEGTDANLAAGFLGRTHGASYSVTSSICAGDSITSDGGTCGAFYTTANVNLDTITIDSLSIYASDKNYTANTMGGATSKTLDEIKTMELTGYTNWTRVEDGQLPYPKTIAEMLATTPEYVPNENGNNGEESDNPGITINPSNPSNPSTNEIVRPDTETDPVDSTDTASAETEDGHEEDKGGCGSTIGAFSAVIVITSIAGVAIRKKKEQ